MKLYELIAYPIGHYPVLVGSYENKTGGIRFLIKVRGQDNFVASVDVHNRLMIEQDLGMRSGLSPYPERVELYNALVNHFNKSFGENSWGIEISSASPAESNYLEKLSSNFVHFRCLGRSFNYSVIQSEGKFNNYRVVRYLKANEGIKSEDDVVWYMNI